ncbi:MAG: ABC transporter ATP-binding protein [Nocardioidaceae bacterium]|nr:ABC transporter ATP-binding protein [Nocardioidaceae bacterium]
MSELLPVADGRAVRRYARSLARRHPGDLRRVVALHALAALAGLAGPWLLGDLVQSVEQGTTLGHVDEVVGWLAVALVAQGLLTYFARYASTVLGEKALAELREDFVKNSLALPVGTVERAGTGDLLTRASRDVDQLGWSLRYAVPETLIALITTVLTVVACLFVGWWVAVPLLLGVPMLWAGTHWYIRRAQPAYLAEHASYGAISAVLAETVEGARTVEALGLQRARRDRTGAAVAESARCERRTLFLRTVWFPTVELGYLVPTVCTLLVGGALFARGDVDLGAVTAATLYVQQLIDPLDRLISWLDELQIAGTSLARLLGVAHVPDDRTPTGRRPDDEHLEAQGVRFSYVDGRDVLHGVDLDLRVGERLAVVGPSGAGKSTLGRLLAGIHPPRVGTVTVGDVGLTELPLDELRGHVALVTQEHHVFVGTVRDNLVMALDEPFSGSASWSAKLDRRLWGALDAVDALGWAEELPAGLDTTIGSGGHVLTPAQAQQLALARLVLADPHTLVLDEATSLLDPRSARHLERSLAAVVDGRTVVAIAHRLFSAHDADRVAVVEDGVVAEVGPHDDLIESGGSYAELWRSWHGEPTRT